MNSERLLKLAEYLDNVSPETFNMKTWATAYECGTTACAMGHACDIPEFKELGLKLNWQTVISKTCRTALVELSEGLFTKVGISAAQALFDLDVEQACFLFSGQTDGGLDREDETPTDVAKRIRTFVEKGGEIEDDYYGYEYDDYDGDYYGDKDDDYDDFLESK
jgi:hypothetical protein